MRVRVADARLYFDVAGMGLVPDGPVMRERPVVLCLHGGPGFDHSTLKPYLTPLAEDAQLIFLDHRGQGRSDPSSPECWNLDTWIDDVRGFSDALGLERPVILGQSFGGIVALGIAIRYPDLPSRLIVSSSIAKFRLARALAMFEALGGEPAREVAERFFTDPTDAHIEEFFAVCLPLYNRTPQDPDILARVIRRDEVALHFFRGEAFAYDWLEGLERISCPTLILAGELDPITTVADHEDMAARIRGSRLEVFPDAGHGVFRDKPTEALSVIREFALAASGPQPAAQAQVTPSRPTAGKPRSGVIETVRAVVGEPALVPRRQRDAVRSRAAVAGWIGAATAALFRQDGAGAAVSPNTSST